MHEHKHEHHDDCDCGREHKHYTAKSFEAVLEIVSENEDAEAVHGWLYNGCEWFAHGWAEIGETVFDLTETRSTLDKAEFYAANHIDPRRCKRYGRLEYFTLMAEKETVGPFDKEFFFAATTEKDPLL
jgi:hypothetical protein